MASSGASLLAITVEGIAVEVAGLSLATPAGDSVNCSACCSLAPGRRWLLAGVDKPWREASIAEVSEFLQSWRASRLGLLAERLLRAARSDLRRLVRAYGHLGGHRLSWATTGVFLMDDPDQRTVSRAAGSISTRRRSARRQTVEADVVIVGSGAGGGVTADILSDSRSCASSSIEEGPLRSSTDFKMLEAEAYPELYQESASRKTADKAMNILQGRCVGGSTTVNWTSSFRTPPAVFDFWQRNALACAQLSVESMSSWFAVIEHKLSIRSWETPPNARTTRYCVAGAEKLGIPIGVIKRNVKGCWNLGYCGVGCPTNAKQSMLLTTIPAALNRGATLYTRLRAERLRVTGNRVNALDCMALEARRHPSGRQAGAGPGSPLRHRRRRHRQPGAAPAQRRSRPLSACSANAPSCIRW
jgi:hypothetical protein